MALVQMNVRIDQAEKAAGDKVFEELGFTPTQVTRAVWHFAATHSDDAELVRRALQLDTFVESDPEAEYRQLLETRAMTLLDDFAANRGWKAPAGSPDLDWRELKEEAYLDLWVEKGLVHE